MFRHRRVRLVAEELGLLRQVVRDAPGVLEIRERFAVDQNRLRYEVLDANLCRIQSVEDLAAQNPRNPADLVVVCADV